MEETLKTISDLVGLQMTILYIVVCIGFVASMIEKAKNRIKITMLFLIIIMFVAIPFMPIIREKIATKIYHSYYVENKAEVEKR